MRNNQITALLLAFLSIPFLAHAAQMPFPMVPKVTAFNPEAVERETKNSKVFAQRIEALTKQYGLSACEIESAKAYSWAQHKLSQQLLKDILESTEPPIHIILKKCAQYPTAQKDGLHYSALKKILYQLTLKLDVTPEAMLANPYKYPIPLLIKKNEVSPDAALENFKKIIFPMVEELGMPHAHIMLIWSDDMHAQAISDSLIIVSSFFMYQKEISAEKLHYLLYGALAHEVQHLKFGDAGFARLFFSKFPQIYPEWSHLVETRADFCAALTSPKAFNGLVRCLEMIYGIGLKKKLPRGTHLDATARLGILKKLYHTLTAPASSTSSTSSTTSTAQTVSTATK